MRKADCYHGYEEMWGQVCDLLPPSLIVPVIAPLPFVCLRCLLRCVFELCGSAQPVVPRTMPAGQSPCAAQNTRPIALLSPEIGALMSASYLVPPPDASDDPSSTGTVPAPLRPRCACFLAGDAAGTGAGADRATARAGSEARRWSVALTQDTRTQLRA